MGIFTRIANSRLLNSAFCTHLVLHKGFPFSCYFAICIWLRPRAAQGLAFIEKSATSDQMGVDAHCIFTNRLTEIFSRSITITIMFVPSSP